MPDEFLLRALLAGCGVALVAGPLGSFVVWRRMAYFGDTLAHAALLGVALGVLLDANLTVGIVAVCGGIAAMLALLQRERRLATDTLLGILSHGTLSIGLIALAFMERVRVDLLGYLFGDILAVSTVDLVWIFGGGALVAALLAGMWRQLLVMTISEELAAVEGAPVAFLRLLFMLMMAVVVAVAMKVVGILLITSMLIIPAATARRFAQTPEAMAAGAAVVGVVAVVCGLGGSLLFDTPSGPSIVTAAVVLFGLSLVAGLVWRPLEAR